MIDVADAETGDPGPAPELDELAALARVRGRMLGLADPPPRIGRYRVLHRLGEGGMGLVYAARDDELDRAVAIKVLRRDVASAESRPRFVREAQALARLSHPNVVQVYEVGHHADEVYIAMELVAGTTLRKWCAAELRTWREIVRVFVAAGRGLAAAHRAGLVHRDFKPDNVLMSADPDDEERPRVVDFGVAHFDAEPLGGTTISWATLPSGSMTQPGAVMGTVAYMAPEQRWGRRADARADQYAFAVSLFEALHGHRPEADESTEPSTVDDADDDVRRRRSRATSRMHALVEGTRKVPAWLRIALERAMATDPDERWPSMDALLVELQRPRRKTWLALAAVATTAALGAGAYAIDRARVAASCDDEGAELASWWADARSAAAAGLVRTGVSFAGDTWASASPGIDRYVDEWAATRTNACRASRIEHSRSEPMLAAAETCLAERRVWLEALVEIWSAAEALDVHGVGPAAAALPPLAPCSDPLQLQHRIDELARAGTADVQRSDRARLMRAEASRRAGRRADALEIATALDAEVDDPVLRAEALMLLGRLRGEVREFAAAEALYQQAILLATEGGRSDLVGEAAGKLVFMTGVGRRSFADARYWGELAQAAFSSSTVPEVDPRRAALLGNLGAVAAVRGEYERALELHTQSVAMLEATLGSEHPDTIGARENLAIDLSFVGRFDEAVQHYLRILEWSDRVLGTQHPQIAATLDNLGNVLRSQGRLEEAAARHERALAINLAVHGGDHPRVADSLENIAADVHALGDVPRAFALYSRALEIERRDADGDTVDVARLLDNISMPLKDLGRYDEAIAACEESLAIKGRILGRDHPEVAWSLFHLGDVLYAVGRYDDSRRAHARVVAIREATMPADSPDLAEARTELGRAMLAAGDARAALVPLERAAKVFDRPESPPHSRARNRFVLAQALTATRADRTRALALARAALEGFRGFGAGPEAAAVRDWIAAHRL